ncbi:MCE family protein [Mycobacterium sp. SMC-4]|uniref:MCE family protein n=1 Tax=Mycobacterium sp. SMC-4 TaxID=2857059 RepID=UPI0021B38333|nr:MCE family protein [Mycobacterium sp. SMC-4]UXA19764.1 MCE family protein [Mycobacterium sp. SMC-4]
MRQRGNSTIVKFAIFTMITAFLTACLFAVFGNYRSATTNTYSAIFTDVSKLKAGDTVRFAGVQVGSVNRLVMQPDHTVVVTFDTDREIALTAGTTVAVRYLNLVGDRYLDLVDGQGSSAILTPGSTIPKTQTAPALDLDVLLGGLKPVIRGLNAQDVNALAVSLVQIVQGQGPTMTSLLSRTSSFTQALGDKREVVQQLIDNLQTTLATLSDEGTEFSGAIDRLQRLVTELAGDREPIGAAIDSLNAGTASLADLLTEARPPLAGAVDELTRLAPNIDDKKDRIETALVKAPENYRKLARLGSYGSFVNYYICSLAVRVTDLQGRTAQFPVFRQDGGRCEEN